MQHVEEAPGRVELEEAGAERHQQDVGGGQAVDGEVAERRGGIEDDEVVALEHPVALQRVAERVPELPAAQGHAPDRDLELGPVEVELGADEVDVRPVGLLDDVGGGLPERGVEHLLERLRRVAALDPAAVLLAQADGVVAGDQREDRAPFVLDPAAEDRGHRALAVEVDDQHPVAVEGRGHREVRGGRGLADAALEVGDGADFRRQPRGAVGAVLLGAAALGGEVRPEPQHLVEGEPARPAFGLGVALRQLGVGAQHPAEVGRGHRDQVAGDLPGGEEPEPLAAVRLVAARHQVGAAAGAGARDFGEVAGAGRRVEIGQRRVWRDAEVGRRRRVGGLGHLLGPHMPRFWQCNTIRSRWKRNRHVGRFSRQIHGFPGAFCWGSG